MPVNKETLSKIWRKSREKIAELPAAVAEQKTAVRVAVLAVLIVAGATLKSKGQLSDSYAKNHYNPIITEIDYNGAKEEIAENIKQKEENINKRIDQSVETQHLTYCAKINDHAGVPASVYDAENNTEVAGEYNNYVDHRGQYEDNGRPNTDPNNGVLHAFQNHVSKHDGIMGTTFGGIVVYDSLSLDQIQPFSKIIYDQETFHQLGGSSNSGANVEGETDLTNSGQYDFKRKVTTPISDWNGLAPCGTMTCSAKNRTDIEMVEVDGEVAPRVYNEYINGSGHPVKFRVNPEDLEKTIGWHKPGDTPPTLDAWHDFTKIGGDHHKNVQEIPVPAKIDITKPANTPQVTLNGNVVTLTNVDQVCVDNPLTGLPDKIMMFVYPQGSVINNKNFSREVNGLQRSRLGFTFTKENPSVDLSEFLEKHGLQIADVDFGFENVDQNALSQPAIETVGSSVREMPKMTDLKMYPNPTSGFLTIETGGNTVIEQVVIYDLTGREVFRENNLAARGFSTNLANLKTGVYVVKVLGEDGSVGREKIILQ